MYFLWHHSELLNSTFKKIDIQIFDCVQFKVIKLIKKHYDRHC